MKRNFILALLAAVILLSLATPAFAGGAAQTCKYGVVMTKNPQTLVITARCRTWTEYQLLRAKTIVSAEAKYALEHDKQMINMIVNGKAVQCAWVQDTPVGPICHK